MNFLVFLFFCSLSWSQEKWLFLGDSLTEGYGISKDSSFPALIENMWNEQHPDRKINVINAGVSGATSASGMSRLRWHTKEEVNLIFIALGANDGLRGQSLSQMKKNLQEMIDYSLSKTDQVYLAGMILPQNYGTSFTKNFEAVFNELSKNNPKVFYMPFLLKDVAGKRDLNLSDGIHPNEAGYKVIANNVFKFIKERYDKIK